MGLTLEFYAGNSNEIIQAINDLDFDYEAVFDYLDTFQSGVNYADKAVSDLITVCKRAEADSLDLVHTWFG